MTTPTSTYRVQVRPDFDLDDVAALVDHLEELGVSHLYTSPLLAAVPGSEHGYDVVDPTCIDPGRGGEAALDRLVATLRERGLGLVVDIVPNHLAVVLPDNRWWWDVLQHGPTSEHAAVFDIDWRTEDGGPPHVVVPQLGAPLEEEVASGAVTLTDQDGDLVVAYHEHRFPLRPGSLGDVGLAPGDAPARTADDPDLLLRLLHRQHHRLVHWRRANRELNYRRFFDITTLAGVRVEDPDVFARTHERILRMVHDEGVDGLRVDHPDGLRDPVGYLHRLRSAVGPQTWLVVEKILEPGEERPYDWPVDGTVGYEFARLALGVLVDPGAERPFTELYAAVTGERRPFAAVAEQGKRLVLDDLFAGEVASLTRRVEEVAAAAGVPDEHAAQVLRELLVAFPVYRTYLRPGGDGVAEHDRHAVTEAVAGARARLAGRGAQLLDLLHAVLLRQREVEGGDELVGALQQLTGPATAKGLEDTAFYRWLRFPALNEVGGDPSTFAVGLGDLHLANQRRARDWPATMLTTSTHDTKRSEDVRARMAALSELPDRWVGAVGRMLDAVTPLRGEHGPSDHQVWLALHTAVGAWPISGDRLADHLVKAAREEKRETSWLGEDEAYEGDLRAFATALVEHQPFLDVLDEVLAEVVPAGRSNSLTQTLLKLTSPGVPDVYQGCEVWDLSLVDPDNRRPVDFARIGGLLAGLGDRPEPARVLDGMDRGVPKLWVTRQALRLRRDRPDLLGPGAPYTPLLASGVRHRHVVAYQRHPDVAVVAPRLTVALGRFGAWDWADTVLELGAGTWHDHLSGRTHDGGAVPLARLLGAFPCALLVREDRR